MRISRSRQGSIRGMTCGKCRPPTWVKDKQRKLRSRRDLTQKWCESTPGVSCVAPRGAFYAFPASTSPESDEIFVKELLLQKHVMVVHGSGFGQKPGTQHFRIVFLHPMRKR